MVMRRVASPDPSSAFQACETSLNGLHAALEVERELAIGHDNMRPAAAPRRCVRSADETPQRIGVVAAETAAVVDPRQMPTVIVDELRDFHRGHRQCWRLYAEPACVVSSSGVSRGGVWRDVRHWSSSTARTFTPINFVKDELDRSIPIRHHQNCQRLGVPPRSRAVARRAFWPEC